MHLKYPLYGTGSSAITFYSETMKKIGPVSIWVKALIPILRSKITHILFTGRNFRKIQKMSILYETYGRKIGRWLGFVKPTI